MTFGAYTFTRSKEPSQHMQRVIPCSIVSAFYSIPTRFELGISTYGIPFLIDHPDYDLLMFRTWKTMDECAAYVRRQGIPEPRTRPATIGPCCDICDRTDLALTRTADGSMFCEHHLRLIRRDIALSTASFDHEDRNRMQARLFHSRKGLA